MQQDRKCTDHIQYPVALQNAKQKQHAQDIGSQSRKHTEQQNQTDILFLHFFNSFHAPVPWLLQ